MTHSDLVQHFGGRPKDVAAALDESYATVSLWKKNGVPLRQQLRIEEMTNGVLKADLPVYFRQRIDAASVGRPSGLA